MSHGREIVPAFCTGLPGNLRLAVFEMPMPDAFTKTFKPFQDALAINETCTVEVVASIEDQPYKIGIGHVQEKGDFFRRLDIPGTMMMESQRQAGLLTYSTSDALSATSKGLPLRQAQTHLRCDTPRVLRSHRVCTVGIGKNDEGALITCASVRHCNQ